MGQHAAVITFAVIATSIYFIVFGTGLLARPELAGRMGLQWTDPSGRTEIRCYYGALSWGLAGFLLYLLHRHHGLEALTGATFLASAVLASRVVGTFVDGGWREAYTKTAIPVEALFVVCLLAARWI